MRKCPTCKETQSPGSPPRLRIGGRGGRRRASGRTPHQRNVSDERQRRAADSRRLSDRGARRRRSPAHHRADAHGRVHCRGAGGRDRQLQVRRSAEGHVGSGANLCETFRQPPRAGRLRVLRHHTLPGPAIAGIDPHFRRIAESTAGEVLWYDGEPAATYYYANCGGTTEDGHFILGNDEARAPYLKQHSDHYCIRDGGTQWSSEVPSAIYSAPWKRTASSPGHLRSVSVLNRTSSGRVEFFRVDGIRLTVSGLLFRSAIGRHIGWDRLKSNWYEVSAMAI